MQHVYVGWTQTIQKLVEKAFCLVTTVLYFSSVAYFQSV